MPYAALRHKLVGSVHNAHCGVSTNCMAMALTAAWQAAALWHLVASSAAKGTWAYGL